MSGLTPVKTVTVTIGGVTHEATYYRSTLNGVRSIAIRRKGDSGWRVAPRGYRQDAAIRIRAGWG